MAARNAGAGGLSDETFRVLVEQAADGIFIATDEGRLVEVNPSGHRLLGYQPGELVGKTIADVLPLREHARLVEALAAVGAGQVMKEDWTFLRKDGSEVEAEVSTQRLGDGLLMAFVRDLDQRRSYEIQGPSLGGAAAVHPPDGARRHHVRRIGPGRSASSTAPTRRFGPKT